uniref:Methyltransferase FkbM domain-containing protein n=1 Tax=Bigelowiella natans TaxID=227086 RepID=A0A6T9YFZ7_BIGNA|mmetsp:Transcript_1945/g.2910  ORF Transcript_1945/g.2910 Transcript_1945/m.2910 type:complete len:285 (+) Transcript_1945:104-958(+)
MVCPAGGANAKTLHNAINAVARDHKTKYKRACGACGDCTRELNKNTHVKNPIDVHCFEPSPATYQMLLDVKEKLDIGAKSDERAKWFIHNKGLHNASGILAWHRACQDSVGDELCTIVPESTPDAIKVEVTTVDEFAKASLAAGQTIHMLKVDAEGLDPAVLRGATETLREHRAVYVMFEFNPGLRDKKPPYGMWGVAKGLTKLLEVTDWLDKLSYDCYLDSRVDDGKKKVDAPALYRINGGCVRRDPKILGWSNVVCASRAFPEAAQALFDLSKLVGRTGVWE